MQALFEERSSALVELAAASARGRLPLRTSCKGAGGAKLERRGTKSSEVNRIIVQCVRCSEIVSTVFFHYLNPVEEILQVEDFTELRKI